MIRETLSLAFFRAFEPDLIDRDVPLAERFGSRPLLAVTILAKAIEVNLITFERGEPMIGETLTPDSSAPDVMIDFLKEVAARNGVSEVVVNVHAGFRVQVTHSAKLEPNRRDNFALGRQDVQKLLGEPEQPRETHALVPHPTHAFALRFDFTRDDLQSSATLVERAGLRIVSYHCGVVDLLNYVLTRHWDLVGNDALFLFVDRNAIFTTILEARGIGKPGMDMDVPAAELRSSLHERLQPLLTPNRKVILVNDSDIDVAAMIAELDRQNSVQWLLEGKRSPELFAVLTDVHRQYAYDLMPGDIVAKPYAPRKARAVPLFFWSMIALGGACFAFNSFRTIRTERAVDDRTAEAQAALGEASRVSKDSGSFAGKQALANNVRDWLALSPGMQGFLIMINGALKGPARVSEVSVQRVPGQPQLRLTINVKASEEEANSVFNQVSSALLEKGYSTVDFKTVTLPDGYEYDRTVNVPLL